MAAVIQSSFGKGEIGPGLYGRTDTAAYSTSLRKARNCIIHSQGGVSNRNGLLFLAPVKTHSNAAPRLVRFQFNTADQYMLEFGNLYMRVMRNDAHVTEATKAISAATQANPVVVTTATHSYTTGDEVFIEGIVGMVELNGNRYTITVLSSTTFSLQDQVTGSDVNGTSYTAWSSAGTSAKIFELTTPYLLADLDNLKFVQSADTVTITHPTYEQRELTRTGHAAWTLTVLAFAPGQASPGTLAVAVNGTTGSTVYLYTVTAINDETGEESLAALETGTTNITAITKADPAVVTASGHGFSDYDEIYITGIVGMTELNGRRFVINGVSGASFNLRGEDSTDHTAWSSGGTVQKTFVRITNGIAVSSQTVANNNTVTWADTASASRYAVYVDKEAKGVFGLLAETERRTYVDDGTVTPDLTLSPPKSRNPFLVAATYPGAAGYYEQRRVFGGSTNAPDTSFFTQTGGLSNMSISQPGQADDAITVTLDAEQVNEIRHYVAGNDLLIFTSGQEWRVNAGDNSGFSATTLRQKPQSNWGCSHLKPIVAGNTILFLTEDRVGIRTLAFSLALDAYDSADITVLANHLFEGVTIVDWSYSHAPDPRVHMVRSDGVALTLTFNQEQAVTAWTTWDTLGDFEATESLRQTTSQTEDPVYFVVKRTINGNTVRYIERTHERYYADVRDAFFVDSGLSLDSPFTITGATAADPVVITTSTVHGFSTGDEVDIHDIVWTAAFDSVDNETQPTQLNGSRFTITVLTTTTFSLDSTDGSSFVAYVSGGTVRKAVNSVDGLEHLVGETVIMLVDGNVVRGRTVSSLGVVTLAGSAKGSRWHIGKSYITDVETLDIEAPPSSTRSTLMQHRKVHIYAVTIRFNNSRGLWYGPNSDKLLELKQREFEVYGEPTRLATREYEVKLKPNWNSNGRIFLRQRDPLPLNIVAVIPHLEVGDD